MTVTQINTPKLEARRKKITPQLGLVCITSSKDVRYKTITRTRYLQLTENLKARTLEELYRENLRRLHIALEYCHKRGITLYRMPSGLFPLSDWEDNIGATILENMGADLPRVGQKATKLGVRVVLHPDQFVVLSSDSPQIVSSSIKILTDHARTFDLMGLPQSPWALMNIHGGKSQRADNLVNVVLQLPDNIKNRLTFENDEHAYSSSEILDVCQRTGVPMVFDAHHHVCHENLDSYDDPSVAEMFYAARETWQNQDWQLVHISNGEEAFKDRKHSDLINSMPEVYSTLR